MKALREIARRAARNELTVGSIPFKRLILPGDSNVETSGMFSISRSQDMPYYIGKLNESWAALRFVLPSTQKGSVLLENVVETEIAALLSFVFQRRIKVAQEINMTIQGSPAIHFMPSNHLIDSHLYGPIKGSPDIIWDTLEKILSVTNDDQFTAISNGLRLYHSALLIAEIDHSAGYVLLVSAMESLASVFERIEATFEDWSEAPDWNEWIEKSGLDDYTANELRLKLIGNNRIRLRQRFISLGLKAATNEFYRLPWEMSSPHISIEAGKAEMRGIGIEVRPDITPSMIPESNLRTYLGKIYDYRSSFVHGGVTFPLTAQLDMPVEVEFEADPLSGKETRVRLPSFAWFERLVRFAICYCLDAANKDVGYHLPGLRVEPASFS